MSGLNKKKFNYANLILILWGKSVASNLNSKQLRFHGVRPNRHSKNKSHFQIDIFCNFTIFHTRRNHFWKVLYIACGADKQRAKKRKLQGILYTKKSWKALPARSLFTNGTELRVHSIFDFQVWLSEQSTTLTKDQN